VTKTTAPEHDAPPAPCPRCGYSQRGLIESWGETCPLAGTCTECGLRFTWSEVLRPDLHVPRWCVEYAPRRWWLLPPIRTTVLRSAWPWWFWRSMKMSHAVRPGRLALFTLMLLLALLGAYALEQAALALEVRSTLTRLMIQQDAVIRSTAPVDLQRMQAELERQRFGNGNSPSTLRGDEWRERTIGMLEREIKRIEAVINGPPPAISHSRLEAVREAVLTPRATISTGSATIAGATFAYPAPIELHTELEQFRDNLPGGRSRGVFTMIAFRVPAIRLGTGAGFVLLVLLPLSFVLLPISRRRAKVRWAHIARVTAYSLQIPVFIALSALFTLTVLVLVGGWGAWLVAPTAALVTWGPLVLVVLWWRAAIGSYLRLPHAWAVTVALTTVNLLAVMGLLLLLAPQAALEVYEMVMP
jgi:hypothetical protein